MQIKNIVVVNDSNYMQGGASKVAVQTAQLLLKRGLNVYFFSAVNSDEKQIKGIKYISTNQSEALSDTNRLRGFFNGIYNIKAKKELKKLLKTLDRNETIVHIHAWTKALSCSVFDVAFKMKFKTVLTLHDYFTICPNGARFNYKKAVTCNLNGNKFGCLLCDCDSRNYPFKLYRCIRFFIQNRVVKVPKKLKNAVGISDMSLNYIKDFFGNQLNSKVIYNPVDINIEKINFKEIKETNYYLYVGRVDKEKGIDIFCEAINQLNLNGIVVRRGKRI